MTEEEIFEKYMMNSHWRREYEEAPSDICREYLKEGYIASGLAWFRVGDSVQQRDAWRRAAKCREKFGLDDWKYIIDHAGTETAKSELRRLMRKALEK